MLILSKSEHHAQFYLLTTQYSEDNVMTQIFSDFSLVSYTDNFNSKSDVIIILYFTQSNHSDNY